MRDYALGKTFDIKFTTRRFTTGVPFLLGGTPVVSIFVDNNTTPITAGITLSTNFASVVGLNNVRVVATSGNGYASGGNYSLVITTGTVDGVSVVGETVGEFSIESSAAYDVVADPTFGNAALEALLGVVDGNVDDIETLLALMDSDLEDVLVSVLLVQDKTDDLTFTKALELDVNMLSINGTTVNGDGAGTPWGP